MLKMMSVNALTDGQSMLSLYVGTLSRVDVDDKSKEDDRLLSCSLSCAADLVPITEG